MLVSLDSHTKLLGLEMYQKIGYIPYIALYAELIQI